MTNRAGATLPSIVNVVAPSRGGGAPGGSAGASSAAGESAAGGVAGPSSVNAETGLH
jgi:hypothetical protein